MEAERRGDDPALDAGPTAPKSGARTVSTRRLRWVAVTGLLALIAVTSLAVARVNGWFVPPYLLLMAWILLGPRGGARTGSNAGDAVQTADRLIPPPQPSPEPAPTPKPEPSTQSRFGRRRRVDVAQSDPVPEPSTSASHPEPKEPQPSAVRGWFARRKQTATLDESEPTDTPANPSESPEASVESETTTTTPKTRRRRRKKVEPPPEPPTEVAWVRVGPNQFVRQETPLSPEANPDLNASPDTSPSPDGAFPIEPRSLDAPSLDPDPSPPAPESPPLPLAPDPSAFSDAPTIEEPPTALREAPEALETDAPDPAASIPEPDTLQEPEPEPSRFEAPTFDEPHAPDADAFDHPETPADPDAEDDPDHDSPFAFDHQDEQALQDDPDDNPQAEVSGQEIDDFPDDLVDDEPEDDDWDDPDDEPPPDSDPDNEPPPDSDPDDPIRNRWDPDEVGDDDESEDQDQDSPTDTDQPSHSVGPDDLQDEETWTDHNPTIHHELDDPTLDPHTSNTESNDDEDEDEDDEDDWSDEDDDEDRWGASAAELAESIVGDTYRSPEPSPPEPSSSPPSVSSASNVPGQGGIVGYGQDLQSYLNDLINMSGGAGVVPAPTVPPPMTPYRPAPPLVPEPSGPEIPTPREPEAASTDSDRTSSSDEDDDAAGPTSPPDQFDHAASEPRPADDPHPTDHELASSSQDEPIGRPLLRPGTRLTIASCPDPEPSADLADIKKTHPQSSQSNTSSHHDRRIRPRDPHLPRAPPGPSHNRSPIGSGTSSTPSDRQWRGFDRLGRDPTPNGADRPGRSPATCSTRCDLGRDPRFAIVDRRSVAFGIGRPQGDLANLPDEAARSGVPWLAAVGTGSAAAGRLKSVSELVRSADDRPLLPLRERTVIIHRIGAPATLLPLLVLVVLSLPGLTRADETPAPSLVPEGYLDADTLTTRLQELAEAHPDALAVRSIAETGEGRDVWLVTLGVRPDEDGEAHRPPAVLIVANLEADHLVGSQVALGLIERLVNRDEEDEAIVSLLDRHTVYVVPRLNPDGAERLFETPRQAIRTNLTPTDEDRDGSIDEDGPDDVDGDGLILRMRVKDAEATLVPDDDDSRILRPARAAEGERAVFSESDEGTDLDGDGERNEDPTGGVNLNRNWAHSWTELNNQTGYSPASEPEVRGLIQFCYDHPEISVVWTFTLHDSLRTEPKKPQTTLANDDLPYFVALSKAYQKVIAPPKDDEESKDDDEESKDDEETKEEPDADEPDEAPDPAPIADADDPLAGLPEGVRNRVIEAFEALPEDEQNRLMNAFENASPLERAGMLAQFIAGLDADKDEPESPNETAKETKATGGGLAPSNSSSLGATTDGAMSEWAYHQFGAVAIASSLWPGPTLPEPAEGEEKPPADGEKRWLYWNDSVMGGRAFKGFEEVEHPTLGTVEIGGWLPGVRVNPPIEEVEGITDAQFRFLTDLSGRMTRLEIVDVKVETRGGGVFEVSARVENSGDFPTALAQGVTTRQAAPVVVRPILGEAKLLGGPVVDRIDRLAGSGGSKEYRWLILAPEGVGSISLEASAPRAGKAVAEVSLK